MFGYLMIWGLLLSGDPQTPEQLFNLGVAAEEEKDYPAAIFLFTEAIGAVTEPENVNYAVMSMRHLKQVYPKVSFFSPWLETTKRTAEAMTGHGPSIEITPFWQKFYGFVDTKIDHSPIQAESSITLDGLTHLGLDPAIIGPVMQRYPIICDNPAVEVLELLESEP